MKAGDIVRLVPRGGDHISQRIGEKHGWIWKVVRMNHRKPVAWFIESVSDGHLEYDWVFYEEELQLIASTGENEDE